MRLKEAYKLNLIDEYLVVNDSIGDLLPQDLRENDNLKELFYNNVDYITGKTEEIDVPQLPAFARKDKKAKTMLYILTQPIISTNPWLFGSACKMAYHAGIFDKNGNALSYPNILVGMDQEVGGIERWHQKLFYTLRPYIYGGVSFVDTCYNFKVQKGLIVPKSDEVLKGQTEEDIIEEVIELEPTNKRLQLLRQEQDTARQQTRADQRAFDVVKEELAYKGDEKILQDEMAEWAALTAEQEQELSSQILNQRLKELREQLYRNYKRNKDKSIKRDIEIYDAEMEKLRQSQEEIDKIDSSLSKTVADQMRKLQIQKRQEEIKIELITQYKIELDNLEVQKRDRESLLESERIRQEQENRDLQEHLEMLRKQEEDEEAERLRQQEVIKRRQKKEDERVREEELRSLNVLERKRYLEQEKESRERTEAILREEEKGERRIKEFQQFEKYESKLRPPQAITGEIDELAEDPADLDIYDWDNLRDLIRKMNTGELDEIGLILPILKFCYQQGMYDEKFHPKTDEETEGEFGKIIPLGIAVRRFLIGKDGKILPDLAQYFEGGTAYVKKGSKWVRYKKDADLRGEYGDDPEIEMEPFTILNVSSKDPNPNSKATKANKQALGWLLTQLNEDYDNGIPDRPQDYDRIQHLLRYCAYYRTHNIEGYANERDFKYVPELNPYLRRAFLQTYGATPQAYKFYDQTPKLTDVEPTVRLMDESPGQLVDEEGKTEYTEEERKSLASDDSAYAFGNRGWALHKVYIKKPISYEEAYKKAQEFIKNTSKTFVKEYENKFNFRNIPKQKFSEFRGKKINDDITVFYGKLKPEYKHLGGLKPPPFFGGENMTAGQIKLYEDYEHLKPIFSMYNKMSNDEFDNLLRMNKPKVLNKYILTNSFQSKGAGNAPSYYESIINRFRN